MRTLHILTVPHGKFLLVGAISDAKTYANAYRGAELNSDELAMTHYVEVKWLAENDIKKVIHL